LRWKNILKIILYFILNRSPSPPEESSPSWHVCTIPTTNQRPNEEKEDGKDREPRRVVDLTSDSSDSDSSSKRSRVSEASCESSDSDFIPRQRVVRGREVRESGYAPRKKAFLKPFPRYSYISKVKAAKALKLRLIARRHSIQRQGHNFYSPLTHFEMKWQTTFGAKHRRATKSLCLGVVTHKATSRKHFLVGINNYDPSSYSSSRGIKLFVEQFVQIMTNLDLFLHAFKAIERRTDVHVKLNLCYKVGVELNSRISPRIYIRLFEDCELSQSSNVCVSLSEEEWRSFLDVGHELVLKLNAMKNQLTVAPRPSMDTSPFHKC